MLKTYKGMDKDMKCRGGFQYEPGKTYEQETATVCGPGFHSCEAPLDVLRYFGLKNGNRYFESVADGVIARRDGEDSKIASSKLTIGAEIGLPGLIKAHMEYTREKAESGTAGGVRSNLAGGVRSNLAGGVRSNLAGGDDSNLAGGYDSNLAGGAYSNLAGGDDSNLAGGDESNLAGGVRSNLAGGVRSNLAGGDDSNLAGGDESNLAGGYDSNLAGGEKSAIIGRNGCRAKAGLHSILCLSECDWVNDYYIPVSVKAVIVDGETIKPDTWYTLKNGEFVEVDPD